jgi:hypothetical protein
MPASVLRSGWRECRSGRQVRFARHSISARETDLLEHRATGGREVLPVPALRRTSSRREWPALRAAHVQEELRSWRTRPPRAHDADFATGTACFAAVIPGARDRGAACCRARRVLPCQTSHMTSRLFLPCVALFAALMGGSCGDVDCDALTRDAGDALDEVIRASASPCTEDSDCRIVAHASACHDFCSRVVLVSSLERIAQTRAAINADQCREFSDGGCRLEIPPCVSGGAAVCRDGRCGEP